MKELTKLQTEYLADLKAEEQEELIKNADIIDLFKVYMQKKGVTLTEANFGYSRTIGVFAVYPQIVKYLEAGLSPDKEGLVNFNSLTEAFQKRKYVHGHLFSDNFVLMAHSYFRRNYYELNNFSPRFVEFFWSLPKQNITSFIALDYDRVRINIDDSTYIELDTWFGAKFNSDIALIPDGIVKLRPPLDIDEHLISFFFKDAYSLDIVWKTVDGIKTFQAEEFKTDKVRIIKDGIQYHPVRYIHAEFDIDAGTFRHFDGAIHFYSEHEYYQRRDSDFNYNNKSTTHIKTLSQKLFKLNGIVDVDTWILLSSHFLTGNSLLFEYFEGEYPSHIREMLNKARN